MKTFLALSGLILLLLMLLFSGYMLYEGKIGVFQSRATFKEVSKDNSLAVSIPSCVKADGDEVSRLQIYCLNGRGLGEPNISVSVVPSSVAQGIDIQPIQGTTDDTGKAIYDVRSTTEGFFDLTISCGDTIIKSDHRTCFTN